MEESKSTNYRAPVLLTKTALGASVTEYYPLYSNNGQDRLGGEGLFGHINGYASADVSGTLTLEESDDRSTWATAGTAVTVSANVLATYGWTALTKRYWRWKYVNDAGAQTTFRLWEDKTPDAEGASDPTAVQGNVASGGTDSGNPVKIGYVAESTIPAAVTDGQRVNAAGTLYGAGFVNPVTSAGAQVTGATAATVPTGAVYMGVNATGTLIGLAGVRFADITDAYAGNPYGINANSSLLGYNGATWDRLRAGIGASGQPITGTLNTLPVVRRGSDGTVSAIAAALSLLTAGQSGVDFPGALPMLSNGTTLDPQLGNASATLLASAARTATVSSADQVNYNGSGIIVTINVSAYPATASVVFTVEAKDPVSGAYTVVLTSAAVVATGTVRLRVGSDITAVANLAAADLIGRTWRVTATHGNADSITYSVAGETMTA